MSVFSPRRVFLGWHQPTLELVSDRLLQLNRENPGRFRRALVVVPTEESGRRLRERLAEKAEGKALLVPRVCLSSTLTAAPDEAGSLETLSAWLAVLSEAAPEQNWPHLFPAPPHVFSGIGEGGSVAWRLSTARQFLVLRHQLEQAGLSPSHVRKYLATPTAEGMSIPGEEDERWREMEVLFAAVDARLRAGGVRPAEEARQQALLHADWPGRSDLIILACLPRISLQTRRFLARLPREKGDIESWIFAPQAHADHFDDWGQPGNFWEHCSIPVENSSLHVLPDARALAARAVRLMEGVPSDEAVLGVCDAEMLPAIHTAFHMQGWPLYLPKGRSPLAADLARLPDELEAAVPGADAAPHAGAGAAELGSLLRNTALQLACGLTDAQQHDFCKLLDGIEQKHLPAQASTLLDFLHRAQEQESRRAFAARYADRVSRLLHLLASPDTLRDALSELLEALSSLRTHTNYDECVDDACQRLRELLSLLSGGLAPTSRAAIFALLRLQFNSIRPPVTPRSATALDAHGWMELLFAPGRHVVLTGLHEGCVPEAPAADSYLPDSLRRQLGMDCNTRRVERDSYLLCSLLASHPGEVSLLVARQRDDGSTISPSRLLTRCPDQPPEALPRRVQRLFSAMEPHSSSLPFERGRWLISAPDAGVRSLSSPPAQHLPSDGLEPISLVTGSLPNPWSQPEKSLSPSVLKGFLACPLRFWLKHLLRLDPNNTFVEDKSALQASDYGSVLHDVLRDFAGDFPRLSPNDTTERLTLRAEELLDAHLRQLFGDSLPITLRPQRELMREKLRRFCRKHLRQLKEGWEVLALEDEQLWTWRNIPLTFRPDRIDRHRDGSLRLIDYKTHKAPPADKHLTKLDEKAAALCASYLPSLPLLTRGKGVYRVTDVQLPLYAAWVQERYGSPPAMLYCNLPRTDGDVVFNTFDISPEEENILLANAEEAARLIRSGLCLYSAESLGLKTFASAESSGMKAFGNFGQLAPDGDLRAMVGLPPLAPVSLPTSPAL